MNQDFTPGITDFQEFLQKAKDDFEDKFNKPTPKEEQKKYEDYDAIRTIGTGAFGRVILAKERRTGNYYAIKFMEKKEIIRLKQREHVLNEKRILQTLKFPFAIYLECFFQDNTYIYFVLPFICGGEMFSVLRKEGKFSEDRSRFYGAQVLLALEYMHYLDIMYRDLKPENILIDKTGYLKLTDFGFAKIVKGRTWTLCGTPEYLAPEVILSRGYGKSADWWSFGVLLYEMTAGYPPFYANEPLYIYEKITECEYTMVQSFSPELKDLIKNILVVDLSKRYGVLKGGVQDIKEHKWFSKVQWMTILNMRLQPQYVPKVRSPGDCSNFDRYEETSIIKEDTDTYRSDFRDF